VPVNLSPPPIKGDIPPDLKEWLNKLYQFIGGTEGTIGWGQIDTDGSELSDIAVRPHSQLTALSADDHVQYVLATGGRNITGDQIFEDDIIVPKTSGKGIKVDIATPTFGWRDLEGALMPKTSGVGSPTLATFQGQRRWFSYAAGEDMDAIFHIPHDYVPGSDLYLHLHWGHNGTGISGSAVITYYFAYAKGHSQQAFGTDRVYTQTLSSLDMTNTPQYVTRIDEFQCTSNGGSASTMDSTQIEPDGLIHVHFDWTTIPTITGGSPNKPFGFYLDLHYQSTNLPTKNKAPNFYA
jgi:hypothetical protein